MQHTRTLHEHGRADAPLHLRPSGETSATLSASEGVSSSEKPQRRSFALHLGCLLLGVGVLLSGPVLEWTIFPEGTIVGTARRAAVLGFVRVVLVAGGAYLLVRRPRVTVLELLAFVTISIVTGLAGSVLLQVAYVPPPVVSGWKSFAPAAEKNQLGFRGRRIAYSPKDYVVVLLGDSQVEATALAFDTMPERLLERYLAPLRAKVFSVGTGGYGQDQELLALGEYFKEYRADLVVLWQTPGNDVWNNVFKTHMGNRNPKPTFWLDPSGAMGGPSEGLMQPLASSSLVVSTLWQLAFGLPWRDKSWERQLPEPYEPLDRYDGPVRTDWQERWDGNVGAMRDENLATEKSHLVLALTPRSKRMQYGLDLTRALMQRIQELVVANNSRLAVFQADDHSIRREEDQIYVLNGKYYRVSYRQYRDNWTYVNRGFEPAIIPVTVMDWRVGPEDGHLNARAANQVMGDLAKWLRPGIVERAAF